MVPTENGVELKTASIPVTPHPGENAFPWVGHGEEYLAYPGLTKRELFAAMAMQGLLASESENWHVGHPHAVAKNALDYADALIKALQPPPGFTEPSPWKTEER